MRYFFYKEDVFKFNSIWSCTSDVNKMEEWKNGDNLGLLVSISIIH